MELPQNLELSAESPESAQNLGVKGVVPWLGLRPETQAFSSEMMSEIISCASVEPLVEPHRGNVCPCELSIPRISQERCC